MSLMIIYDFTPSGIYAGQIVALFRAKSSIYISIVLIINKLMGAPCRPIAGILKQSNSTTLK